MNQETQYGPRRHISIGQSQLWRPNLVRLKEAWQNGSLVLWLGAGVSMPYGLPNWNDLLLSLLLRLPPSSNARGGPDVDGWHGYYPHYRQALGHWMMDHFKFDPVKLARVFADDHDLKMRIRRELYAPLGQAASPRRTSLDALVDLISDGDRLGHPVPAIITLNYDDLLEMRLAAAEIRATPIFNSSSNGFGVPIYHVHGYLPRTGDIPNHDLVFTESVYHQISSSGFHWSVKRIMRHLHLHTVLFVGVSMNDPNLRRFLDMAHTDSNEARHFAMRGDYSVDDDNLNEAMKDIEKSAKVFGKEAGRDEIKTPPQLRTAIRDVCAKAHDYDKKALRSLGVRPVWVRETNDISKILDAIRTIIPE